MSKLWMLLVLGWMAALTCKLAKADLAPTSVSITSDKPLVNVIRLQEPGAPETSNGISPALGGINALNLGGTPPTMGISSVGSGAIPSGAGASASGSGQLGFDAAGNASWQISVSAAFPQGAQAACSLEPPFAGNSCSLPSFELHKSQLGQNDLLVVTAYAANGAPGDALDSNALDVSFHAVKTETSVSALSTGIVYNGKIFFSGYNSSTYLKLYSYDPASKTLKIISNTRNANGADDAPKAFAVHQNKLFFASKNANGQYKLFVYDDIEGYLWQISNTSGSQYSADNPDNLISHNGYLYFVANNSSGVRKLYQYNSSQTEILQFGDISGAANRSDNPQFLTVYNGKLYFSALNSNQANKLYVHSGTGPSVSHALSVVDNSAFDEAPRDLLVFNGKLYFTAAGNGSQRKIFSFDSVSNVTLAVSDVPKQGSSVLPGPSSLTVYNGKLYFTDDLSASERPLFSFDEASNSITRVSNILPGAERVDRLFVHAGKLYFSAKAASAFGAARKLYSFDDASGAIARLSNTNPVGQLGGSDVGDDAPSNFVSYGGLLYFTATRTVDTYLRSSLYQYNEAKGLLSIVADGKNAILPAPLGSKLFFTNETNKLSSICNPSLLCLAPDTQAPSTSIVSPAYNETVSGMKSIEISSNDNYWVSKVELEIDDVLKGTAYPVDASSNAVFNIDTTLYANGPHTLKARAYDFAGHQSSSLSQIRVGNGDALPVVSISYPAEGERVNGYIPIILNVSDDLGISEIYVYSDVGLLGYSNSGETVFFWDTNSLENGPRTIWAEVYDTAGQMGRSATMHLVIENDYEAPTAWFVNPVEGATVSRNVQIEVGSFDNIATTQVDFYLWDWLPLGSDTTPEDGFKLNWNSLEVPNGEVFLTAVASDRLWNSTYATVHFNVFNDTEAPYIALNEPLDGAVVSGSVNLVPDVYDDVGVSRVDYYLDGSLLGSSNAAPFSLAWDSLPASNGTHQLHAVAFDAAGNSSMTDVITITVNNDTMPPSVSLTSPADGAAFSGNVILSANATDNVGVARVEFYADGATLIATVSNAPYQSAWDVSALPAGSHTVLAKAFDASGNVGQSAAVSIVIDHTPPSASWVSPANGARVSGLVGVIASASDNVAVAAVDFYRDGVLLGRSINAPYSLGWDTRLVSDGAHTLYARAYDSAGNNVSTTPISVNVDNLAPTVALTAPANGATVYAPMNIQATASDASGITRVEFYRNGALMGTDSTSPYAYYWNARSFANGTYTFQAIAYDAAGNQASSSVNTVTLINDAVAPTNVAMTAPASGAVLSGSVTLSATASDDVGIKYVYFYVGSTLVSSDTTAPYSVSINSRSYANGSYALTARAVDMGGNSTTSAPVNVTFNNDLTPPTVAITGPASGTNVTGTITLSASASDNVGVSYVQFYSDGLFIGNAMTAPYNMTWNSRGVFNGTHAITARAYDAAGNSQLSAPISVTVENVTTPPLTSVTSPSEGAIVPKSTTITITGSASDDVSVQRVEFWVNGASKCIDFSAPYTCAWAVPATANAAYQLQTKAYDNTGAIGVSSIVNVMSSQ